MYFSVSLASAHLDFSVSCSHPTLISHFFSDSYKNLADDEGWNIFQDTCEFYEILKKGQKRILIIILGKILIFYIDLTVLTFTSFENEIFLQC